MSEPRTKAMILTVGGAVKPLIESLNHYRPQHVCFVASQQSIDLISEVKRGSKSKFKDHKVLLDDINDITHCFEKTLECSSHLEKGGIAPADVAADFTGGTKVMSSALTLVCIAKGYRLNYTGGAERDNGAMGKVINGTEQIFEQASPWEVLAIEDRKRAAEMFNKFQFEAAKASLAAAADKTPKGELKHYLEAQQYLTDAYMLWDKFHHSHACDLMEKGCRKLRTYSEISRDREADALAKQVEDSLAFLRTFKQQSKNFKKLCSNHLLDLLANAKRRATEGRYDDGVARLYRTLELLEQVELSTVHNIDSDKVPIDCVPAKLKDEFSSKYRDHKTGRLKLPLQAGYRLLDALGNEIGSRYCAAEQDLRDLLNARNYSILAHGTSPLDKGTFDKMWQKILSFGGINEAKLPLFPEFPLPYS